VLNKRSTPRIRALKSERTRAIYEEGLMAPDALKGIRDVYFHGDMEAAPALAEQSAGLTGERSRRARSSRRPWRSFSPSRAGSVDWRRRNRSVESRRHSLPRTIGDVARRSRTRT
jgi:hypothetical protein